MLGTTAFKRELELVFSSERERELELAVSAEKIKHWYTVINQSSGALVLKASSALPRAQTLNFIPPPGLEPGSLG